MPLVTDTFDRTKMYYKIVNSSMKHYKHQYRLGLNVDEEPFLPQGYCLGGGLYFTTAEHLYNFVSFGNRVAEITIPDDAQVYRESDGMKFKADKIYIHRFVSLYRHPIADEIFWHNVVTTNFRWLKHVPKIHRTKNFYHRLIRNYPMLIHSMPEEFHTDDDICELLIKSPYVFSHIPEKFQTKEILLKVAYENPNIIEYATEIFKKRQLSMPEELKTKEFCQFAINNNPKNIAYVPADVIKDLDCVDAIIKKPYVVLGLSDVVYAKLWALACMQDNYLLMKVPPTISSQPEFTKHLRTIKSLKRGRFIH